MPAHLTILAPQDYRLQELSAPAQEPVSVAEVKSHLRISDSAQDDEIVALAQTARNVCEQYTGKFFIARSAAVFLDRWPSAQTKAWWDGVREGAITQELQAIRLPVSPVQDIEAIYLHDAQGGARTIASENYQFDALGGRLSLSDVALDDLRAMNAIEIRVNVGYGTTSDVPMVYKQAIRQLTAYLFTHRGDAGEVALVRSGAAALLAPFREVSLR